MQIFFSLFNIFKQLFPEIISFSKFFSDSLVLSIFMIFFLLSCFANQFFFLILFLKLPISFLSSPHAESASLFSSIYSVSPFLPYLIFQLYFHLLFIILIFFHLFYFEFLQRRIFLISQRYSKIRNENSNTSFGIEI